jgi:tryptophan synthase alpha chain
MTLTGVLGLVRRVRERSAIPIVLFSYLNPIHRFGQQQLAAAARDAGVDGVLVTDLPPEEAEEWLAAARNQDLDTIFLAAPTSPEERLRRIAEASRGFVYAISRTGVTGERQALSDEAQPLVERLKALTQVPVALGFGISTAEQVAEAGRVADGVVVGSALVHFIEEDSKGDVAALVRALTRGSRS